MQYNLVPHAPENIVATSITHAIGDAVNFAVVTGSPTAVVGPPGIGKTTALLNMLRHDPRARYGMVSSANKTVAGMYMFVAAALDVPVWGNKNTSNLAEVIHHQLSGYVENERTYYLLVDEVQTFQYEALRELIRFNEIHGLPIIMVGNESSFRNSRVDRHTLAQIVSRLAKSVRLDLPTAADFAMYGRQCLVADHALPALAAYGERTSFRDLRHLVETARRLVEDPEARLTPQHLESALVALTSDANSLRLLKPAA